MARMMPKINSKTIANRGEQLAYPLFRDQLPNDWVVIYDYKFCVMVDHQLKDGQIDFIIIAPQKGILFVEVKGSYGLRRDLWIPDIKEWWTGEIIENPFHTS